MSEIDRRRPWFGLASLAIALSLLWALRFLSTPEGQHWVEDFFSPLGHAAILLGVAGPMAFLGLAAAVLGFSVASVIRREPLYLGEIGLTIVGSLFLQAASNHAELWGPYPGRLLTAGIVVFGVGLGVRRLRAYNRR